MATTQTAAAATLASEPFALEPVLVERIWGQQDLSPWHDGATSEKSIGEIWLTAEECKVAGGARTGETLAEVTKQLPEAMGDPQREGFPLLIKLLFPREKLSVQVHPNDAEAQALGMPRGKTECWYVLSAEPGAEVAVGFREPLSKEKMRAAIQDGSIEEKLRMLPVKAGDLVFVEAGTIHAIGPGMVVLETQQYSDTTYRLWDYGRPRELHVEAGTAVTRAETSAGLVPPQVKDGFTRLVECAYFAVDHFDLLGNGEAELGEAGRLQILIALTEGCSLRGSAGKLTALPRAQAVVLPASEGAYALLTETEGQVIRVLQPS